MNFCYTAHAATDKINVLYTPPLLFTSKPYRDFKWLRAEPSSHRTKPVLHSKFSLERISLCKHTLLSCNVKYNFNFLSTLCVHTNSGKEKEILKIRVLIDNCVPLRCTYSYFKSHPILEFTQKSRLFVFLCISSLFKVILKR